MKDCLRHTNTSGAALSSALLFVSLCVDAQQALVAQTTLVVADRNAKYKTVQEAVMAVPAGSDGNPTAVMTRAATQP